MAWIRSAMHKAAEVGGVSSLGDAVRSHTGYNVLRSVNAFSGGSKKNAQNMNSYKEAITRLEEASVTCQGEDRVRLLRRWLVTLGEIERIDTDSSENDDKNSEESQTSNSKDYSPDRKSDVALYHDQDLGVSPANFRDVFLQSQALEGITMSMILGAPNEEEILLLHELFGLCLTGGKEVHDVIIEKILDLSEAFSVYDDEVLTKRSELLQFAESAIAGLKVNADILRIDSEVSEIHQNLKRLEHPIESDGSSFDETSDATLEVIKESVSPIRLCCRLESLLLNKKLLNNGDTQQDHARKVDKLKVLSESLLSSASKTEQRISDHRQQKEDALHLRVAKTSEVSQLEKDLGVEISELEKQRDKLVDELQKVNNSLAAANVRLENARDEREQFDDANNQLLVDFKSKDDELSKAIVSYRAEAHTCSALVEFLEATWSLQSSFLEQKGKMVNDELEIHEEYFVHVAKSLLTAYMEALEPAFATFKKHMMNLIGYEKAIDPDEEFLQDIEQRKALEQAYLAAEIKVITILDAAESVKEQFYHAIDNVSRKGVEPVNELCESIEKVKVDFEILPKPTLNEKSTQGENKSTKGSPKRGASPSSKRALPVDIKSILAQKLVNRSPSKKPYIPLGGSSENSPVETGIRTETKKIVTEKGNKELLEPSTSDDKKFLKPSMSHNKKLLEHTKEFHSFKDVNTEIITEIEKEKIFGISTKEENLSSGSTSESDESSEYNSPYTGPALSLSRR